MGVDIISGMRVIKRSVLLDFGEDHRQARGPLEHWYHVVKEAEWEGPADVKRTFGTTVDFVGQNRAIFDIKGNDFRLIGEINYRRQAVYIRFLGTHTEYDKVDAATVKLY
jgi:mRNA interferase HigB